MKHVAKIIFLILFSLTLSETIAQPCTPDANFPGTQGTLPDTLERTIVNVPYSAVIQFKAPKDTMAMVGGQTLNVTVDSLRITGVIGLPSGFSYACHNSNCMILGGAVGCAKITGTAQPGQLGTYPLKVVVKLRGRFPLFGIPVQIPESLQYDTNFRYAIVIGYNTGVGKLRAAPPMVIYPNPSNGQVHIALGSALKEDGIIEVKDLSGRKVFHGALTDYEADLNLSHLPKGLYLIEVTANQGNYRSRLLLE